MKKLFVLAAALILSGCATADPRTDAEWDQFFAQQEIAAWVEQMRYENVCNKFVYAYAWGELIREAERKEGLKLEEGKALLIGDQFAGRVSANSQERDSLIEMFNLGRNGKTMGEATSPGVNACLAAEWHRMQKFHDIILKRGLGALSQKSSPQ